MQFGKLSQIQDHRRDAIELQIEILKMTAITQIRCKAMRMLLSSQERCFLTWNGNELIMIGHKDFQMFQVAQFTWEYREAIV